MLILLSVDLVWNVCMGAAVIMLSIISKGAVGMGDGLLFLSLGTVLSFEELLSAFLLGLFCCCFWGIVVLFLSGKGDFLTDRIPRELFLLVLLLRACISFLFFLLINFPSPFRESILLRLSYIVIWQKTIYFPAKYSDIPALR